MKKSIFIVLSVLLVLGLSACGNTYVCNDCEKTTSKAYYDMNANINSVLCEECAREYWMPMPYQNYRVK